MPPLRSAPASVAHTSTRGGRGGKRDIIIPCCHGEMVFKACTARKMFVNPHAMEHNTNLTTDTAFLIVPMFRFFALPDYSFQDRCDVGDAMQRTLHVALRVRTCVSVSVSVPGCAEHFLGDILHRSSCSLCGMSHRAQHANSACGHTQADLWRGLEGDRTVADGSEADESRTSSSANVPSLDRRLVATQRARALFSLPAALNVRIARRRRRRRRTGGRTSITRRRARGHRPRGPTLDGTGAQNPALQRTGSSLGRRREQSFRAIGGLEQTTHQLQGVAQGMTQR